MTSSQQPAHGTETPAVFDLDQSTPGAPRHGASRPLRVGRWAAIGSMLAACGLVAAMTFTGGDPDGAITAVPAPSASQTPLLSRDLHRAGLPVAPPSASASGTPSFDPFNAATPEVAQGAGAKPSVVALPTAPSSIASASLGSLGDVDPDQLFTKPVQGRASSGFGMRFHPVLRYWKLHTGQDWAASCGTPVGAARAGTVVSTGWAGGNGVQVKIDHGVIAGHRVVTTYNHLSAIGVSVGQRVEALDGIGRVGNTGYSTGCHLHFEVIVDGQFTDPIPWLNGKPTVVDLSKEEYTTVPKPSPSDSPSPTVSETSASPSAKESAGKPSKTASAKPSKKPVSPSPTKSAKPSGSATPSATPSGSPSPSPSGSPSPSLSGSPSPSPSQAGAQEDPSPSQSAEQSGPASPTVEATSSASG